MSNADNGDGQVRDFRKDPVDEVLVRLALGEVDEALTVCDRLKVCSGWWEVGFAWACGNVGRGRCEDRGREHGLQADERMRQEY